MDGGGKRGQGIPGTKKETEQRNVKKTRSVYSIVSTGLLKPGPKRMERERGNSENVSALSAGGYSTPEHGS